MIEWRLFEVKQHKYKLVLGWVTIWWVVLLIRIERHVTTTISIKSLTLEGTHSDSVISSYLEGMSLQSLRHCSLKSVVVSSVPLVQHCSMCGILVVS